MVDDDVMISKTASVSELAGGVTVFEGIKLVIAATNAGLLENVRVTTALKPPVDVIFIA